MTLLKDKHKELPFHNKGIKITNNSKIGTILIKILKKILSLNNWVVTKLTEILTM